MSGRDAVEQGQADWGIGETVRLPEDKEAAGRGLRCVTVPALEALTVCAWICLTTHHTPACQAEIALMERVWDLGVGQRPGPTLQRKLAVKGRGLGVKLCL